VNREQAYKLNTHITGVLQAKRWKEAVDKIYDDISAQTCSTCEDYDGMGCEIYPAAWAWLRISESKFSCNQWEKQDDSQ